MELKKWQRIEEVGYKPKTEKVKRHRGKNAGKEVDVNIERVRYEENSGKLIVTDLTNADYLAYQQIKQHKQKNEKAQKRERINERIESAIAKGKILGVREYKKSDAFKKKLEKAYNKGSKDSKPKASVQDRIIKAKQRLLKEQEKIKELENKL